VSDTQLDGDDIIMNYRSRSGKAQLAIQQLPSFRKELDMIYIEEGWMASVPGLLSESNGGYSSCGLNYKYNQQMGYDRA
jgi:hypothetical protein